jgi:hypothetical protein
VQRRHLDRTLGLDHTKLTYRHSGRDFRLTDVHGRVITDWLASGPITSAVRS